MDSEPFARNVNALLRARNSRVSAVYRSMFLFFFYERCDVNRKVSVYGYILDVFLTIADQNTFHLTNIFINKILLINFQMVSRGSNIIERSIENNILTEETRGTLLFSHVPFASESLDYFWRQDSIKDQAYPISMERFIYQTPTSHWLETLVLNLIIRNKSTKGTVWYVRL